MNTNSKTTGEKSDVALREEATLAFWREHNIFHKSVAKEAPQGEYVFYDGPPFATGLPHYGHILAGTIKDAVPRFWTMNGYCVRRKWGWDCHGLPLENLIEKKLGLATKRDIEEYGVKNFNEAARDAVMEFADDWREIIPRVGRFVDMDDDYKTMDSNYTESVWWVFKQLHEKGLVYEGFKSMHLCPRCGTTLSNFEVNQGYKDIKDIAVFVELPLRDVLLEEGEPVTSLIVWTTTPWTLPGNMAAAVHEDYDYVVIEKKDEGVGELVRFVLAKDRLEALFPDNEYTVIKEIKGTDLIGKRYQPPFDYWEKEDFEGKENAWRIFHADYVELGDEGTGAVHLAPAYGDEDMELAKAKGIPIVHHVDEGGHFRDFVADFAGQLVKPKDDDDAGVTHLDADIEIVKALKTSGRLFKKENITHSYPHCWRCDTPLLNYATTSWFVEVTKIKDQLVQENSTVNWVPDHVGHNRFGKWLEGARDWAVSRQRYWGAPLPVWKNPETEEHKIIGSLKELQHYVPKSGNSYYMMRHGESEKNVLGIVTGIPDAYPLTEKGKEDTREAAVKLKGQVDFIITSPVLRAKETAELMADELGFSSEQVLVDERIREAEHGVLEGKLVEEYRKVFPRDVTRFTNQIEGGESWTDIKQRVGNFLFDLEHKYKNKKILIVSHGDPLGLLTAVAEQLDNETVVQAWDRLNPEKGVVNELPFTLFPHNDNFELDFHRPYIDAIELYEGETKLERVPDVFDCWFESGSMPYAETHYPFENLDVANPEKEIRFPADFISESVDQTRGWFYSLLVLGVALYGKAPFQNAITNGLVLAEDGKKMSKKLQNYPDPVELVNRQGADAMRFYLLSSSIIKGEDLNFSEKEVQELQRKNLGRLHNVLAMYEQYADGGEARSDSPHVLDRWIVARVEQTINDITTGFKTYELDKATRPLTDLIDDLSVWYLRRSRDRLKADDKEDKANALTTLHYTLRSIALVMAPSMPFYADYLWSRIKEENDAESVHLSRWPTAGNVDTALLAAMDNARKIVSQALEARTAAQLKVRQPIASLTGPAIEGELQAVILDEINAKEYVTLEATFDSATIKIDTAITPALQAEGDARELMRSIQAMRKDAGLEPHDRIALTLDTTDEGEAFVETFAADIQKTVGAERITYGGTDGQAVSAGDHTFTIALQKL